MTDEFAKGLVPDTIYPPGFIGIFMDRDCAEIRNSYVPDPASLFYLSKYKDEQHVCQQACFNRAIAGESRPADFLCDEFSGGNDEGTGIDIDATTLNWRIYESR